MANVIQVALAFTLLVACAGKLSHVRNFSSVIVAHDIPGLRRFPLEAAVGLVAAELVLGIANLFLWEPKIVGAATMVLFGAMAMDLSRVLLTGQAVPCGCYGGEGSDPTESVSWWSLARTTVLVVLSGTVVLLSSDPGPALPPVSAVIAGSLVAVCIRFMGLISTLISFLRTPGTIGVSTTRRMSFRHVSSTTSLFATDAPPPAHTREVP